MNNAPSYFSVRDYLLSRPVDHDLDNPAVQASENMLRFLTENGVYPANQVNRGRVHPSKSRLDVIAAACHLTPKTAQLVLNDLEMAGDIEVNPSGAYGLDIKLLVVDHCAAA